MISDITLGQYFPQKSPLHATDPRLKICLLVYAIVLLFAAGNFASLALALVYIGLGMAFSKIPCKLYWKSLKPIWFLVAFTGILNIFYGAGEPLWKFGIFQITLNGIYNAIFVSVRIIAGARVRHDDDHRAAVCAHLAGGDRQNHGRPESPRRGHGKRRHHPAHPGLGAGAHPPVCVGFPPGL